MKVLAATTAAAALKVSHKSHHASTQDSCDEILDGFEMMFYWMDEDESGSISADEAIAFGIPPEDIEMLGYLDADNNGELTPDELVPLVNVVLDYYGCEGL